MGTSSSPANPAGEKPIAGIVTALVLGVPFVVLAVVAIPNPYDSGLARVHWGGKAVHLLGNLALIAGALMSQRGNARGNRVVRVASKVMIPAVLGLLIWYWTVLAQLPPPDGGGDPGWAPMILALAVIGTAPWLLYLRLFRKSRYP